MATPSYDSALDFLPEVGPSGKRPAHGPFDAFKTFVRAINDGLKAQHDYKILTARGMPTADAAKVAFRDHLKND